SRGCGAGSRHRCHHTSPARVLAATSEATGLGVESPFLPLPRARAPRSALAGDQRKRRDGWGVPRSTWLPASGRSRIVAGPELHVRFATQDHPARVAFLLGREKHFHPIPLSGAPTGQLFLAGRGAGGEQLWGAAAPAFSLDPPPHGLA